MRCLIYQTANDRLHNASVGISAFLWRQPETETSLAQGPGGMLRVYVEGEVDRCRLALRWGFEPAWVGPEGLRLLGKGPWPWVSVERAPVSRIFAHPLRYQRCLIPADALYVAEDRGTWLNGPEQAPMFLAGVWDQGTVALLTAETLPEWRTMTAPRMPVALPPEHFDRWLAPTVTHLQDVQEIVAAQRADWTLAKNKPAIAGEYSLGLIAVANDAYPVC